MKTDMWLLGVRDRELQRRSMREFLGDQNTLCPTCEQTQFYQILHLRTVHGKQTKQTNTSTDSQIDRR